jgi:hypothetical protein
VLRAPPPCLNKARDGALELGVPSHVVQHWEVPPKQRLKLPMCEIFDRSDFRDFYTIKSLWVGDFGAKI